MKIQEAFPHPVREIENLFIPLSDGCRLAARLWLPQSAEREPVPVSERPVVRGTATFPAVPPGVYELVFGGGPTSREVRRIEVHADAPTELVVSPDAFVDEADQRLTLGQLAAGTDSLQWGSTAGEGRPIVMTVAEWFSTYAAEPALVSTDRLSLDQPIGGGNTINNLAAAFPSARIVELHFSGETNNPDFTWSSVRLAFEPSDSAWRLVAITSDHWTP